MSDSFSFTQEVLPPITNVFNTVVSGASDFMGNNPKAASMLAAGVAALAGFGIASKVLNHYVGSTPWVGGAMSLFGAAVVAWGAAEAAGYGVGHLSNSLKPAVNEPKPAQVAVPKPR